MNIETFLICDAATDSQGKLNILGAFDSIYTKKLPAIHRACSIALRIRFSKLEEGEHKINITIMDEDGNKVVPDLKGNLNLQIGDDVNSKSINLIMNLQGLQLKNYGEYSIDLNVDGKQQATLPLYLRKIPDQPV